MMLDAMLAPMRRLVGNDAMQRRLVGQAMGAMGPAEQGLVRLVVDVVQGAGEVGHVAPADAVQDAATAAALESGAPLALLVASAAVWGDSFGLPAGVAAEPATNARRCGATLARLHAEGRTWPGALAEYVRHAMPEADAAVEAGRVVGQAMLYALQLLPPARVAAFAGMLP